MGFKIVNCAIAGIIACSCSVVTAQVPKRHHLSAPTYYIAINGSFEASDAVRMQGATNLPPGANIELCVSEFYGDTGDKGYSDSVCVRVERGGLFRSEAVRMQGATNLPPGANIELYVSEFYGDTGDKGYSDSVCVRVERGGLFKVEVHPKNGTRFHPGLFAVARS